MTTAQQAAATPYWQAVHKKMAELPTNQTVFITSVERPEHLAPGWIAGRVFEADRRNAAQRLTEGKHRLSTPEEIETYKADQKQRTDDLRVQESLRAQKEVKIIAVDRDRLLKLGEV